jgi:hypothetical protein
MLCMPDGSMFGEAGTTTWSVFAYTRDRTAFSRKATATISRALATPTRTTPSARTSLEPSDAVSGKSVVPTTASTVTSLHCQAGWTRGSRLVAFVDMKVDELWNNDMTLFEINTGTGTPNTFVVYNQKKSVNDGTREKKDQVTVAQQSATRDNESEMLGGLDAGQSITIPGTSIVVEVCALDSEATFDFAKVSVYDTSLDQSPTCNVVLDTQVPQGTLPVQIPVQVTVPQIIKPATQTIATQNAQQAQLQNTQQQQLQL